MSERVQRWLRVILPLALVLAGPPVAFAGSSKLIGGTPISDRDPLQVQPFGGAASGSAVSGNPVLVAGSDGTNAQAISTDVNGHPNVNPCASSTNLSAAVALSDALANPTTCQVGADMLAWTGSTWARAGLGGGNADAQNIGNVLGAQTYGMAYNGTNWDRARSGPVLGSTLSSAVTTDPCQSSAVAKVSTPLAISTATTTQLVALATGKQVIVCHYNATLTGTTPTAQFEYGTGALCATGLTTLTGAYAPTAGGEITGGFGGTVFAGAASNALCVVTGGTAPGLQGVLTYVLQ